MNTKQVVEGLSSESIQATFERVYGQKTADVAAEVAELSKAWPKLSFETMSEISFVAHLLGNIPEVFEMFKKLSPSVQAAIIRNRKHFTPVSLHMYLRARALLPNDKDLLGGVYKLNSVWARWTHTNSTTLVQASLLIERGVSNEVAMGLVVGKLIEVFGIEQMKEILALIYGMTPTRRVGLNIDIQNYDLVTIAQRWDTLRNEPMEWTLELYQQEVKETF